MPVTKQAIKKVRQDRRKSVFNLLRKDAYKKAVKDFLKGPSDATLKAAYSSLDLAAKTNLIHKKKASRLKSRLSKKMPKKAATAPKATTGKKITKKTASK